MSKDMKNVNNWHWVDKNCINWAKTYFEEHLSNVSVEKNGNSVTTKKVTSVEGDVDVNQRKGKIITIFDVAITLTFEGKTANGTEVTGKIEIPEVAHDTDADDYVFDVSIDSDNSTKQPIRDLIRTDLSAALRKKLVAFAKDLIQTHGKDVQVDSDFSRPSTPKPAATTTTTSTSSMKSASSTSTSSGGGAAGGPAVNTTTLSDTIEFQAPASDIYNVLLDETKVAVWSRSKASIEPKVGAKFSLFGGTITGEIQALEKDKKIVQSWRINSWPAGHYSTVTMELDQGTSSTVLKVKQAGVPIGEEDLTRRNWNNFYWTEIKRTFGYVILSMTSSKLVVAEEITTSQKASSSLSSSSSSSSSRKEDRTRRRRRHKTKTRRAGSGSGAGGMVMGAGFVALAAFVVGLWYSKK
ncbi:hypothetical protein DFQ26_008106 [Actinomortierella ambigua]|nr:hypothetical protein DFQ26_008106 [Actinomortierella ambigua]